MTASLTTSRGRLTPSLRPTCRLLPCSCTFFALLLSFAVNFAVNFVHVCRYGPGATEGEVLFSAPRLQEQVDVNPRFPADAVRRRQAVSAHLSRLVLRACGG